MVMREDEQHRLRQRNTELEGLVVELQAQLRAESLQEFSSIPKSVAPLRSGIPTYDSSALHLDQSSSEVSALHTQVSKLERTIEQLQTALQYRQRSQTALRQRETRWQAILDALQTGVLILNPEGMIEACNATAEEILQCSAAQLISRHILELDWQPIEVDRASFDLEEFPGLVTARTGIPCSDVILGIQKPSTQITWLSMNSHPLFESDQALPDAVVVTFVDVTHCHRDVTLTVPHHPEREAQERWLRLLESVVIHANDAVIITEAEPVEAPGPRITYVNEAFTRMLGYTSEEIVGQTPRILQGPKTNDKVLQEIRSALKQCQPTIAELINYHKDGSEVWIELSIFPVMDQARQSAYWVGLQRDITQRKKTEAELQKALEKERELSDLKSSFVTTVSHEFRTPLSTILSSADMLEFYGGNCSFEKQLEHIERIQTAALNMKAMLNDILVLEQAEAGRVQFEPDPLDLRSFCEGLLDEMRLNDQNKHRLVFESQPAHGEMVGRMDSRLLRQIFTNLLSNALKYSPKGSEVRFRLTVNESIASFEIQDQGIGIPAADQSHLFEAFHRGKNVGMIAGNGLGLAIVKQSVEMHQGQIDITSQEHQGTTVRLTLPLQPQLY